MIQKISFIAVLLFWAGQVHSQVEFSTMGDSVQLRINSNGSLGVNLSDLSPSSNLTRQTNNHFLKQAGLYLSLIHI